jgi:hypothetical protein
MIDEYQSLLVVIPTRNRAQLAIGAIQSVLSQEVDNVRVLVSDNSTIAEEATSLSRYCEQLKDERLRYLATPADLPMSPHWDWAMKQALQFDATHLTVLTDRMVFRPGELRPMIEHVKRHPANVLSYKHDKVIDYQRPVKIALQPWTGKLFELRAERLLALTAQCLMHECLPRMLNCVVPRSLFERIETRFGAIFGSVAPDFNFCYKALALEEVIIFFDKAILIHRALDRSNGETLASGFRVRDHADFLNSIRFEQVNFVTPVPEIRTRFNFIANEYCLIRKESGSPRFPELSRDNYLKFLAMELSGCEDLNFKNEMMEILRSHGWEPPAAANEKPDSSAKKTRLTAKLRDKLTKRLGSARAKDRALTPAEIDELEFNDSDEALAYAFEFPRPPDALLLDQQTMLQARPIGIAD